MTIAIHARRITRKDFTRVICRNTGSWPAMRGTRQRAECARTPSPGTTLSPVRDAFPSPARPSSRRAAAPRARGPRRARARYLGRLSRPLLDRIDLHVELPALLPGEVHALASGDASEAIRTRVESARQQQRDRFRASTTRVNATMSPRQVRRFCPVSPEAERLLAAAMTRLGLSARGHDRVLKVARSIADLAGADALTAEHCAEAIQYRGLDRQWRA